MNWIALRMLTGDRSKYLGLIFGVSFATLLMSQQVSIFMGILTRTGNQILEVRDADIWVMDNRVRYLDEAPGLQDTDLMRVRGVQGVAWAVRFYTGTIRARLEDGNTRNVHLVGLDDETLVGAPREMIVGSVADLNRPDAVIIDKAGYEYMWGKESYQLGRTFQINDRRAVLVGVCKVGQPFFSDPIIYTRYSQAARYVPRERTLMNYVLVKPKDGVDHQELCRRIEERTGRTALTRWQFFWKTVRYFLASTGIPVNFGITIALGFIVGAAVTGQTLYLFVLENLKQFGALKAMGIPNGGILRMILLQSLLVGGIGYGLGVGMSAIFFITTGNLTHLAGLHMTWVAYAGTGVAVVIIVFATSIISARRVLVLEPAMVFRG
ncbi:MAG TPA: ABC transporter permease [Gemmataceae bacterium]|nr:ABC transporter permease [Gemmataceae bacterium]